MWITFKSKLNGEKNYDVKINLNKIEHIIFF